MEFKFQVNPRVRNCIVFSMFISMIAACRIETAMVADPAADTDWRTPGRTVEKTMTPAVATLTPSTADRAATSLPTSTPMLLGTPYEQPDEIITIENVDRLSRLSSFGRGQAMQLQYSYDGRLFAVATMVGVYLYDSVWFDLIRYIPIENGANGVSFSPDDLNFATTSDDGSVKLWRVSDGELLQIFEHQTRYASGESLFSPDGRYLFSCSGDGAIRMWDVNSSSLIRTFRGEDFRWVGTSRVLNSGISISADGRLLATTDGNERVWVWNVEDGLLIHELVGKCVAFSPSESHLAICVEDDRQEKSHTEIWNVSDWEIDVSSSPHSGVSEFLRYSPDGTILIESDAYTIWIRSATNGEVLRRIEAERRDEFISIAVSPSSESLSTLSLHGQIDIRGELDWNVIRHIYTHLNGVHRIAFSPDASTLATAVESAVYIWRIQDGVVLRVLEHAQVEHLAFSPDGELFASGAFLGGVRVWRVADGELLYSFSDNEWISSLAFSPDGSMLAGSFTTGYKVMLWDVTNGKESGIIPGEFDSLAFSPDGTMLALGGFKEIYLFEFPDLFLDRTLEGASNQFDKMVFTPEGLLVTLGSSQTIIWRVSDGEILARLRLFGHTLTPDRSILASSVRGYPGVVKLWKLPDGQLLATLRTNVGYVKSLAFSPLGDVLVIGGTNGTAEVWGLEE